MYTITVEIRDRNGRLFGTLYTADSVEQAKFKAQQDHPGLYIESAKIVGLGA